MSGFGPFLNGFDQVPFDNNIISVKNAISDKTAGVLIETIQGEGCIRPADIKFLKELRKLCNKKKILLILDEVQCGISRTGTFFSFEKSKIKPDIVTIAKGIGGGFPLGAVLMNKKVASGMIPGTHGSTFGGNPLAMAVGNAVMDIVSSKKFLKNIENLSKYFLFELRNIQETFPQIIKSIRGKGFLIGIQLHKDQTNFIKKLLENR